MKYLREHGIDFSRLLLFSRSKDVTPESASDTTISLGFPSFGSGEHNFDHMGQYDIVPTDNFNMDQLRDIKNLKPIEVLRHELVKYYGYVGGVQMFGSAAAIVEIPVGERSEKLLAMEYAGMVLALRRIDPNNNEIVRLDIDPELLNFYRKNGLSTFSNYGDRADTPWEKLESFRFKDH